MGLTAEIEEKIKKRRRAQGAGRRDKDRTTTEGYQVVLTIKEFKLSPFDWQRLSRFDQRLLMYQRVMEEHYTASAREEMEKERKKEDQKRKMLADMPKQVGIR